MTLPLKKATTAMRYYSPDMPLTKFIRFFFSEEWEQLRVEPGEWRMVYCPQCHIPHGVRKGKAVKLLREKKILKGKIVRPFRDNRKLKRIICECGRRLFL